MDPQDNQQGQERQQSSVDRINRLARGGRTAYRRYRRARSAFTAARTAFTAARAGAAAAQGAVTAASNPAGVVVIIIVIIILVMLIAMMGGGSSKQSIEGELAPPPEGVTFDKEAVDASGQKVEKVDNGDNIKYEIVVKYDTDVAVVPLEEILVIDGPRYEYEFVSASGIYQQASNTIIWRLSENSYTGTSIYTFTFTLVIKPLKEDFISKNALYINTLSTGGGGGGGGGGGSTGDLTEGRDSAPTNNRCDGQWFVGSHPNFGDPVCSYTPEKFSAYIKEVETKDKNAEFWEDISIAEGGSPRIGGNINVLGSGGAGTFQMIPRTGELHNHGPGNWPGPAGPSSPHGDVTWQRQIEQAVGWNNYLNKLSPSRNFMYWGTAYCLCYFDSYRKSGKGWCDDIIEQKAVRCPYQCPNGNSCSIYTDRLGEKRGNEIKCGQYPCN